MKEIKNILDFVTSVHGSDPAILHKIIEKDAGQKMFRLADGLHHNQFENDEQAMISLYGSSKKNDGYRQLKSRLKDRLTDLIFLRDTTRQVKFPYDRSLLQAQRNIYAAQILIMRDHRDAALTLLKPAFQSAVNFNHTHLAVHACKLLCIHFAFAGNKKEWNYYSAFLQNLIKLNDAETEIEMLNNRAIVHIVHLTEYTSIERKLLSDNYAKAKKIYAQHQSHFIAVHYFRMAIHYFHGLHQFKKVIELCRECTTYLEANPKFYQRTRAGEFALIELESCLLLREFNRGRECVDRLKRHFVPYTSPWFVFYEHYFLLAMRTGNYLEALEIFYTVIPRSRKLTMIQQERWRIYEAYLNFALPDSLPKKQFNLFRFLNDVPLTSHDKAGYNFSILVAQIILLININDVNRLRDLEYSFRQYLHRYIKERKHPRHYYFGRMLWMLFRNNSLTTAMNDKIQPYKQKLNGQKNKVHILEETEVIPYEDLWKMLMEKCGCKK
jgi:hypothetical protein